jgi:uncharacterized RDD family membrane protein YckC
MLDGGYEIVCENCRSPVSSEAASCPHCGHALMGPPPRPPEPQASFFGEAISSGGAAMPPLRTWEIAQAIPRLSSREFSYGGFWIRVVAALIDGVILAAASYFLTRIIGPGASLVGIVGQWLYYAVMESSPSQGTIGKIVCGLAVTDTQGEPISFGRATGRYFAKILSTLILFIGFLMVGWTRQKRGLHDFVAGTLVVRR